LEVLGSDVPGCLAPGPSIPKEESKMIHWSGLIASAMIGFLFGWLARDMKADIDKRKGRE
jgi:hypothetical protein